MEYINEEMTISRILGTYPDLLPIFKKYGLGKFETPEILEKLGGILKLKTALKAAGIEQKAFIELLNSTVLSQKENGPDISLDLKYQRDLTLLALLPCGMKMPFSRTLDNFASTFHETDKTFNYHAEGNVNHELSYYPYIDSVESIEELPDIIISSDINSFYHKPFKEKFLDSGQFVAIEPEKLNQDFLAINYPDPEKQFTMLSANLLVMVFVKDIEKDLSPPKAWKDILTESYRNKVAMRGDGTFFCNGVLLPIFKLYGMDGVRKMGESVTVGLHPSEMVSMINSGKKDIPLAYIMPYFFAQKITSKNRIEIIIPEEGALVSPVQMLVKKSSLDAVKTVTDFLCGKDIGEVCARAFFPSTHGEVENQLENISPLYWLGWDFLKKNDIAQLKKEVETVFMDAYHRKETTI